jgi:chemotaxis protein CheD
MLKKRGARRESIQAKVFGGAQVMAGFTSMNVSVRKYKIRARLPGDGAHTGRFSRCTGHSEKVCFSSDWKALVKQLAHAHPETLAVGKKRRNAAVLARSHQAVQWIFLGD